MDSIQANVIGRLFDEVFSEMSLAAKFSPIPAQLGSIMNLTAVEAYQVPFAIHVWIGGGVF